MTQEANPYRPPESDISEAETKRFNADASKGRRFGTLLVDYACFIGVSFCIGFITVFFFGSAGMEALQKIPDFLFGCVVIALYYIFFEGIWARTPGKLLFGTIVVNESGGRPSIGQVTGRTLCRFIPFEAFSCLGERGWHDSVPKTRVVLAKTP